MFTQRQAEVSSLQKKLTSMFPFAVMRYLIFTLIYSFLTYDFKIWGHSSVTQLNRLEVK